MFDVSFSELMVIAVVALLVIGPEKLPKVARTLGALAGRLQRYAAQVKEEVNREARFADLQKLQSEIKQGWEQAEEDFKNQAAEIERSIKAPVLAKSQVSKSKVTKPQAIKTKVTKSAKNTSAEKSPVKELSLKKGAVKKAPVKKTRART